MNVTTTKVKSLALPGLVAECLRRYGHWYLALAAVGAWTLSHYTIGINVSPSLPQRVFLIHKGEGVDRGSYVAFRWHGGGPYKAGSTFVKRVAGAPGDVVEREGRRFYVHGEFAGVAKAFSQAGVPLEPMTPGVLGTGEYYVTAPHPDSLDSRYKLTGWINQSEIIGRAYPLF